MAHTCRGVQAWHGPLVSSWLANRGRWHSTLVVETRMLCVRAEHGLDNRRRWGRHWSGLRKSCHPVPLVVWWCILLAVWCIPLVYQQVYSTWVPSATGFCCFSTLSHAHTHNIRAVSALLVSSTLVWTNLNHLSNYPLLAVAKADLARSQTKIYFPCSRVLCYDDKLTPQALE